MLPATSSAIQVRPASQIRPEPIRWLWTGHLALGTLTMLDGDPGLGKSLFALDLCARLSTGRSFPDDTPSHRPANSLLVTCEDGDQTTVRPRLEALGADLDRVFLPPQEHPTTGDLLRFPRDLDLLARLVSKTRARIVVIDPIMACLEPMIMTSSDQSIRRALYPLVKLAETYQFVAILIRHLNKSFGGKSLYRGSGSIGFIGSCRSAWLLGRDPESPARRVLAQSKNNLAPISPSLAFEIQSGGSGLQVRWRGTTEWTADQVVAASSSAHFSSPRNQAREFLRQLLADGPRTSRDIWAAVDAEGLSEKTLRRAREDLKVRTQRVWRQGCQVCYWLLGDQKLPVELAAASEPTDLEPWLAPLRDRYPPSTPLDDW
jgi:RecA-family ATPase